MKKQKLLAALLALTIGLAGCAPSKGGSSSVSAPESVPGTDSTAASSPATQEYAEPADADRMCFLPTDTGTEGDQLPFTASYITPYPELNIEEADLFYHEGTPEIPFLSNQAWYATFAGEDGARYAITLENEDTLALKIYLDGDMSYLSLVNTVYFARQQAMG